MSIILLHVNPTVRKMQRVTALLQRQVRMSRNSRFNVRVKVNTLISATLQQSSVSAHITRGRLLQDDSDRNRRTQTIYDETYRLLSTVARRLHNFQSSMQNQNDERINPTETRLRLFRTGRTLRASNCHTTRRVVASALPRRQSKQVFGGGGWRSTMLLFH